MRDLNTLDHACAEILGMSNDIPDDDVEIPIYHDREIDELALALEELELSLRSH
jgi:hypothetical protein